MRHFLQKAALIATLLATVSGPVRAAERQRPNFLVIVADDLGYSDIGAFGGEIATPNLDRLALQGARLTDFHTAPTCSPTRAMLLTGADNHVAGLGSMAESLAPNQQGRPGYEGYLRRDVSTIAERLSAGGYRTLFSGKWHLGLKPDQDPHARGFACSFAMLRGAHNHFGRDVSGDPAQGAPYTENGKALTKLPAGFYSSDAFADRLIDQLRTCDKPEGGGKPFFAMLTFTAPHWPLQARSEDIARYRGRYDEGFDVLRQRRLQRQQQLGLLAPGIAAHTPRGRPWSALNPEQKQRATRDMEIYAAMVDRLDRNVGRVLDALRASGELDNTVVIFLSDNGAEGLDPETTGKELMARSVANADNSLANRGNANSYVAYGPGWAQAATAPSWLIKGYATEGGTRTVAFVSGRRVARAGTVADAFTHVSDIAPTILDLAGVPQASAPGSQPIAGRSWVPYLTGQARSVRGTRDIVGTELFGSRSVRRGEWKLTDIGDRQWRLFNLAEDPGETRNLAEQRPELVRELSQAWADYARRNGVILPSEVRYRP
jgi:arylsulfatase